jgi:hypothetical protein
VDLPQSVHEAAAQRSHGRARSGEEGQKATTDRGTTGERQVQETARALRRLVPGAGWSREVECASEREMKAFLAGLTHLKRGGVSHGAPYRWGKRCWVVRVTIQKGGA